MVQISVSATNAAGSPKYAMRISKGLFCFFTFAGTLLKIPTLLFVPSPVLCLILYCFDVTIVVLIPGQIQSIILISCHNRTL